MSQWIEVGHRFGKRFHAALRFPVDANGERIVLTDGEAGRTSGQAIGKNRSKVPKIESREHGVGFLCFQVPRKCRNASKYEGQVVEH